MNDKSIYCFLRVAELEHMTKAAKRLYMSQSQLSRVISDLEREMGAPLFDRTGRNIKLNEAGKAFYQYALKIAADYEEAKNAVRGVVQRQMFQVSFGTNVGAYTSSVLSYILKEMPGLSVRDTSAPRQRLIAMLQDGRIDFVITSPPISDVGTTTEIIFNELPCVIYPEGHWLAKRTSVSLEELSDETLIGVQHGYGARDAAVKYYRELGIDHHFAIETGNTSLVEKYVQNGLGIAFVPKSIALTDPYSRAHMVDLDDSFDCPIGITRVTDRALTDSQKKFYDLTKAYIADRFGGLLAEENDA